jgi:ketosteroid isomerase-like protein
MTDNTDSGANLAVMGEIYAAYNEANATPLMNALADDFRMIEHAPESIPWGGVWEGRKGIEDFLDAVAAHMTHEEYVCDRMIGQDDIVTSWGRFKSRCNTSGKLVEGDWMHRMVFRDGKIVEIHEFLDSLSGAEAFGLASLT